jgi:hypothetical protein
VTAAALLRSLESLRQPGLRCGVFFGEAVPQEPHRQRPLHTTVTKQRRADWLHRCQALAACAEPEGGALATRTRTRNLDAPSQGRGRGH